MNYAPFASFGGWSGAINAASPKANQDAAYDFLSYMSSPAISGVDVTLGKTGYNPYRTSQFTNIQPVDRRRPQQAAADELPRRHQGQPREHEHGARPADPADQALRAGRARHGRLAVPRQELDAAGTEQAIADGWNAITDEAGKDKQLAAYVASLGVQR